MTARRRNIVTGAALVLGLALLVATLWVLDLDAARVELKSLGLALPLVLAVSGVWHLARTIAWAACFPRPRRVGFWRLARVRLAAEAFSYLTLRGIAGEPLKVLLLDDVDPKEATAAVALERLAFMVMTTAMIGAGAIFAILTLPLSRLWFRIFRAFAIGAAVVVAVAAIVLAGRGTYLARLVAHRGRVGRFIAAVEQQLLQLARHNPRRLLVLAAMNAVCYASMAAEVLIVLRASGVPAGAGGSLAVETFSRVASFASAFIPANLGALEASSVAAVAAIGAGAGGAALALARRLRGIFWAAAGLLLYPRKRPAAREAGPVLMYSAPADADDAAIFSRVAGLPIAERVFRAAHKAGYDGVAIDAPGRDAPIAALARRAGLRPLAEMGTVPIFPGAHDEKMGTVPISAGQIPRPGGSGLAMLATRVEHARDLPAAEREIRAAVFKPTDHNLARINRRLSLPISIALLRTPITPNQFSVGLLVLGLYAAWLFSRGTYLTGVAAAALSLGASILDGCDGEIARLKHQESAFGCWLETFTDYTYYFAIFGGMTIGAVRYTGHHAFYWIGVMALGGLATTFLLMLYLRHRLTGSSPERFGGTVKGQFKQGGHLWTRVLAKLSNAGTRAQMPYGILAVALAGALPLVIVLCAIGANVYWMALIVRFRAVFRTVFSPRPSPVRLDA